jgi:Flp pilus assembly protein CpaB
MSAGRGRRTGIILIILIIFVLLIGIAALFLLRGGSNVVGGEPPTAIPSPTPPPTELIIVAKRDLPRGARLTIDDVDIMAWPKLVEAPVPIGALVVGDEEQGGAGLGQVEGRITRVDILQGQPILDFMITPGDEPFGLADTGSDAALLIPTGKVAITVPVTQLSAVGYALREGDHVDVFMSLDFIDVDQEFQTISPNTGILITDDVDLSATGLSNYTYTLGRQENGPFGTTLLVIPNQDFPPIGVPRKTTQMVIDNAIVVKMGTFSLTDLAEPIVVTAIPPQEQAPEGGEDAAAEEGPPPEELTPTPLPVVPIPDIVTLAMDRQDALVLKYALETGADMTLALRSALDDEDNEFTTDSVTQQYILDFYNVQVPSRLSYVQVPSTLVYDVLGTDLGTSAVEAQQAEQQANIATEQ